MQRTPIIILLTSLVIFACTSYKQPISPAKEVTSHETTVVSPDPLGINNDAPNESRGVSKESLEEIAPKDIIQDIVYFGGLGGGCGKQLCECKYYYEDTTPALFTSADDAEHANFFNDIAFEVCGLQESEVVTVTVETPSQSSNEFSIASYTSGGEHPNFMIDFEFTPALPNLPGTYHFVFSGKNWAFNKSIEVLEVTGPSLFLDYQKNLTFYKFHPNETVRLFAYKNGSLVGWQEFQISQTGILTIPTTIEADFIAVGEISGQVFDKEQGQYRSDWAWLGTPTDIYCQGAANPSGIKALGNVEFLTEILPIYKYDFDNSTLVPNGTVKVGKGTITKTDSNAVCQDKSFFWKVCINDNCEHYVPESNAEANYLRPTASEPIDSPSPPSNMIACPGTLPTRLTVGMNAEVTTSGMAPQLSLRAQPSMSAEKVHVIAAGRDMVIFQGPMCADNSYWWYIQSEQGFEGWAREGDNEDYWIDPLP